MKPAPHWLAHRSTIALLWLAFLVVLALTVGAEAVVERHAYFGFDAALAFNAWFGFGACVAMILLAKLLGVALKRRDTYYDDER
jgi:hypothetical protein